MQTRDSWSLKVGLLKPHGLVAVQACHPSLHPFGELCGPVPDISSRTRTFVISSTCRRRNNGHHGATILTRSNTGCGIVHLLGKVLQDCRTKGHTPNMYVTRLLLYVNLFSWKQRLTLFNTFRTKLLNNLL